VYTILRPYFLILVRKGKIIMNSVTVMGNLTRDPEIKVVGANSTTLAKFTIAYNNRIVKNGEKIDEPIFINCEAWGKTAESLGNNSFKGQKVLVEGEWSQDSWQDKETGQNRIKDKVKVRRVHFITWADSNGSNNGASNSANSNSTNQQQQETVGATAGAGIPESEVPF
jgi:single-strand DNA-binding protein